MDGKKKLPYSWRLRRALVASLTTVGFGFASVTPSPLLSAGKKPEEFRIAIKAQDRRDWNRSISLLRQALAEQPEDGERVRIYGTRYMNYLPHYYLGLAMFKKGDCAGALKEWDQCLSTGAIGAIQTAGEHEQLLKFRSECLKRRP